MSLSKSTPIVFSLNYFNLLCSSGKDTFPASLPDNELPQMQKSLAENNCDNIFSFFFYQLLIPNTYPFQLFLQLPLFIPFLLYFLFRRDGITRTTTTTSNLFFPPTTALQLVPLSPVMILKLIMLLVLVSGTVSSMQPFSCYVHYVELMLVASSLSYKRSNVGRVVCIIQLFH